MQAVRALQSLSIPAAALEQVTRDRTLPVDEGLAALFPFGGLRRGSTVAVHGSTAVLLKLLAAATANGSWAVVVGLSGLGVLAAAELGVAVDRLAVVARPGSDLGGVLGALLDGMDLVVVDAAVAGRVAAQPARRLAARARSRGAVLLVRGSWPTADIQLTCGGSRWHGLGHGHGHLRSRHITVSARGRGAASRPIQTTLELWTTPANSPHPTPTPAENRGPSNVAPCA